MTGTSISERLADGDLTTAVAEATEAVKAAPADTAARGLLAELLCLAGQLERADTHFGLIGTQDPGAAMGVSLLRKLVRAETARSDWHQAGRLPEVLGETRVDLRPYVEAGLALRLGEAARAGELLAQAEAARVPRAGRCNDRPFEDFRDLDDRYGGFIEVLTGAGDYRWVALDAVRRIRFAAPRRPRDLLWREAELELTDDLTGTVYLPAIYMGAPDDDDPLRLGRTSAWVEAAPGLVCGKGQRCFLAGEESVGALDLETIEFG